MEMSYFLILFNFCRESDIRAPISRTRKARETCFYLSLKFVQLTLIKKVGTRKNMIIYQHFLQLHFMMRIVMNIKVIGVNNNNNNIFDLSV